MDEASPAPAPAAAPKPKGAPGIAQSIALCAIFYVVVIAVAVLCKLQPFLDAPSDMATSLLLQQLVAWPFTIWLARRWARGSLRELCSLGSFSLAVVPALLLASFGATILLLEAAGWIPVPDALRNLGQAQAAGPDRLVAFLSFVVVAPLAEEIFFRGQVLAGYRSRYTITKAVWASAVVFALFHLNPWQAIVALPLGLAYAWLVLRTGSIALGMLSHAAVNFSANFLLHPLARALGYDAEQWGAMRHFPTSMLAVGAAAAGIGGVVFWRQLAGLTGPPAPVPDQTA